MFEKGLVIGKFYPPHKGHKYLIDTALDACHEVTVIVCWKKSEEISGYLRAAWIQKTHPTARVLLIDDNKLDDDDSEGWATYTKEILGYTPDAVFTSEAYGDPYAKYMGCVHVLVDRARTTIPISGTMVRSDPQKSAKFLEPHVKAHFAKRICVLGAESTGTTTLAKALADHYHCVWVPEYGRYYSEGRLPLGEDVKWTSEEFVAIAKAQQVLENSLAASSNGLVICDTDAFATSVWHERYLHTTSPEVEAIADAALHDLYILTGDEIPFVQDGTRDGEHIRHDMHKRFVEKLSETKRPYILVSGSPQERLAAAITAINMLL
jgi:NadR type nicotinamide-nucleotide adenylyltransferase